MADKSITNRKSFFCAGRPSFLTGNGARAAFVIKTNGQLAGRFFRAFEVKALTKYPMRDFVMPKKKFKKKRSFQETYEINRTGHGSQPIQRQNVWWEVFP